MDWTDLSDSDVIAAIAAGFAGLALAVSVASFIVSRKAFKLSKKEHEERYLTVRPYLIHAYKQTIDGDKYCFFALSYTNRASVGNSIGSIELELEYEDETGGSHKLKVRPTGESLPALESDGYRPLTVPVRMEAKESVSGWVAFRLPSNEHHTMHIECYRVHAVLADDEVASVRTYLINEVSTETDEEDDES